MKRNNAKQRTHRNNVHVAMETEAKSKTLQILLGCFYVLRHEFNPGESPAHTRYFKFLEISHLTSEGFANLSNKKKKTSP